MPWFNVSPASVWERSQRLVPLVNATSSVLWQNFTVTLNQTVFNLTNFYYTPDSGTLFVFLQGVLQIYGIDYAETDDHTITLTEAPVEGDILTVIGFVGASGTPGNIPIATTTTIGGIIVGPTLTINPLTGELNSIVGGGTVTHTTTDLTLNSVVIGNAGPDIKVVDETGAIAGYVLTHNAPGAAPTWQAQAAVDTTLRADLLNFVGTTATGRGADIVGYIGRYAGSAYRTLQERVQDNISVSDYPDMAAVSAALTSSGIKGTIKVPIDFPQGVPGTFPLTYPVEHRDVQFETDGYPEPCNMFAYSGADILYSAKTFKWQPNGAHVGSQRSGVHMQNRPIGSGANGPGNSDIGLSVSIIKKDYLTTAVEGELDGVYVVAKNGGTTGADTAGFLADVAIRGNTGLALGFEAQAYNVDAAAAEISRLAFIAPLNNPRDSTYLGCHSRISLADLSAATLSAAYFADEISTGRWKYWIHCRDAALADKFTVDRLGFIIGDNLGKTPTAFASSIVSGIGAFTTAAITSAYYIKVGKQVYCDIRYSITTVGTADGSLRLGLPFVADATRCVTGMGHASGGVMTQPGLAAGGQSFVGYAFYDATTCCTTTGANGHASFFYTVP